MGAFLVSSFALLIFPLTTVAAATRAAFSASALAFASATRAAFSASALAFVSATNFFALAFSASSVAFKGIFDFISSPNIFLWASATFAIDSEA